MKFLIFGPAILYLHSLSLVSGHDWWKIKAHLGEDWRKIIVHLGSVVPKYVTVSEKTPTTVYCGSLIPTKWSYSPYNHPISDRSQFPVLTRHRKGRIHITLFDLEENDKGFYYCHGKHQYSSFQRRVEINVTKNVPDNQVIPSWVEVSEGSSVKLTCGSLKPVDWFSLHFRNQSKTVYGNSLILWNLKKAQSGPYMCRGITGTDKRIFYKSAVILVDGYVELFQSRQIKSDFSDSITYLPP